MLLNECQGDYVIFSVEQVNGENNDRNNKEVRSVFSKENINYKELQGCYKGVEEVSYIVNLEHLRTIKALAMVNNQESILLVLPHFKGLSKAYLLTQEQGYSVTDKGSQFIGYLCGVSKEIAIQQEAYSYRKDLDQYFIVTPNDTDNT